MSYEHLHTEAAALLEATTNERIEFCKQDRWVMYTAAQRALDELDDLRTYPRNLRPSNILVVGRQGNGKSSILEYFTQRHPIVTTAEGRALVPVLRISMPEKPSESEFWSSILWSLSISHREGDTARHKKRQAKNAIADFGVRVLLIDELNNATQAGKETTSLLTAVRNLSSDLRLSIGAAGTQEAIHALNRDPNLKMRFTPIGLPRWTLDIEYRRFLASYERMLPLKLQSNLASKELATTLYKMSGEAIVRTVQLLKKAAEAAITSGEEQITEDLLKGLAWTRDEDWDSVSRAI